MFSLRPSLPLLSLVSVTGLVACASAPPPPPPKPISGILMQQESATLAQLSQRYIEGEKLVRQGEAAVKEGQTRQAEGERMIAEGRRIMQESEQGYGKLKK